MPLGDFKKTILTEEETRDLITRAQQVCVCKGDNRIDCDPCDARAKIIEYNLRWLLKICIEHVKCNSDLNLNAEEFMADAIEDFLMQYLLITLVCLEIF